MTKLNPASRPLGFLLAMVPLCLSGQSYYGGTGLSTADQLALSNQRQQLESEISRRQQLESEISQVKSAVQRMKNEAEGYETRLPTAEEVEVMEKKWKDAHPFVLSVRMPKYAGKKILAKKPEVLSNKIDTADQEIAALTTRLAALEKELATKPTGQGTSQTGEKPRPNAAPVALPPASTLVAVAAQPTSIGTRLFSDGSVSAVIGNRMMKFGNQAEANAFIAKYLASPPTEIEAAPEVIHTSAPIAAQQKTPPPTPQEDYDRIFDASSARVAKEFPWASNPKSAGYQRMAEIDAQLSANKDPLYYAPDKPLLIAQMVAKEFVEKVRKP